MGLKDLKIKTPAFTPLELNGENVETIFRRCLVNPDVEELGKDLELDDKKTSQNGITIGYLLGQLRLVHQGCYDFDYGTDLVQHYCGTIWSEDGKHNEQACMLLRLGESVRRINAKSRDEKLHIWLNREMVCPTLSVRDTAFMDWYNVHGPYYQGAWLENLENYGFCKTPEDAQKALNFYQKGAQKGDPQAQWRLAFAYKYGEYGLPKDPAAAFQLFSLAAEAGDPLSCSGLAGCYASGEGTSQDYEAAIHWYYRAYENGANSYVMMDFTRMASSLAPKSGEEKDRNLHLRYCRLAMEALKKAFEFQKAIADEPARDFSPGGLTLDELNSLMKNTNNLIEVVQVDALMNKLNI